MKKIFIVVFLSLFYLVSAAQDRILDTMIDDNTRLISCSGITYYNMEDADNAGDKHIYRLRLGLSMYYDIKSNLGRWYISLFSSSESDLIDIRKGASLLFKIDSSEIITLNASQNAVHKNGYMANTFTYTIGNEYSVKENEINKLINGNISKIRLEYSTGIKDCIVRNNTLSIEIEKCKKNIQERLSEKKSILDGF